MMRATTSGTQTNFTLSFISAQPLAQGRPRDAKRPAHRARLSEGAIHQNPAAAPGFCTVPILKSSINKDHPSLMRLPWLWGCGQRDALSIKSTACPIR
jgi:hypothetical protein